MSETRVDYDELISTIVKYFSNVSFIICLVLMLGRALSFLFRGILLNYSEYIIE